METCPHLRRCQTGIFLLQQKCQLEAKNKKDVCINYRSGKTTIEAKYLSKNALRIGQTRYIIPQHTVDLIYEHKEQGKEKK